MELVFIYFSGSPSPSRLLSSSEGRCWKSALTRGRDRWRRRATKDKRERRCQRSDGDGDNRGGAGGREGGAGSGRSAWQLRPLDAIIALTRAFSRGQDPVVYTARTRILRGVRPGRRQQPSGAGTTAAALAALAAPALSEFLVRWIQAGRTQ